MLKAMATLYAMPQLKVPASLLEDRAFPNLANALDATEAARAARPASVEAPPVPMLARPVSADEILAWLRSR